MAAVRAVSGGCCDADVLCRRWVCVRVCAWLCRSRKWCFWGGGGRKHTYVCLRWSLTQVDCHHCSYWWNVTLLCVHVCVSSCARSLTYHWYRRLFQLLLFLCVSTWAWGVQRARLPHKLLKGSNLCLCLCVFVHPGIIGLGELQTHLSLEHNKCWTTSPSIIQRAQWVRSK